MFIGRILSAAAMTSYLLLPGTAAHAGVLKTLYSFDDYSGGEYPQSAALVFQSGLLYGTLPYGGGPSPDGVVFEINPKKYTETVLHAFTGSKSDGSEPLAGLVSVKGILYGTTEYGGKANDGTVFEVDPKTKSEKVIYSFKGEPDGANPYGALIEYNGNLYGTTSGGGEVNTGTVFAINIKTGAEKIIYTFVGGNDGAYPQAGVTYYGGNLYGTTAYGGSADAGTVFGVNLKTGGETVLYNFAGQSDGERPVAPLAYISGILYGTTYEGGGDDDGTVFAVNASTGAETILHSFTDGADGGEPQAGFVVQGGNLFSTAPVGGTSTDGVIYEISPTTGKETVLYNFTDGGDGESPTASLIYQKGAFYGTSDSGAHGAGTVFKFTP